MIQKRIWPRIAILPAALLLAGVMAATAQSPDAEMAAKAERGRQAMAEGNFELASQIYGELNDTIPNNPGLLLNLGMAKHLAGRDREAVPHLQAALKIDPNVFPANLFLGASYLRSGQIAAAVAPLKKAIELNPEYPDVRAMLGDALVELGRPAEAVEHYRKLTQLQPDAPGGWVGLGRSYESLSEKAFIELEQAAPESAYMLALVAGVRVTQQQYSSAFYLYKQALERDPGMRGIHQALAGIYRSTEHADWAAVEEEKEKALPALDCASEKIECSWRDERFDEVLRLAKSAGPAESAYWQVRAYDGLAGQTFGRLVGLPPSPQRHLMLAELHSRNGRHMEAAGELRAALKLAPGHPGLQRELASALYGGRDYEAAEKLTAKLLGGQPNDAELNWIRGDSLLALQRAEESLPPLKRAVESNPELLPAHHALGRAQMQLGEDAEAIPHLKAALPLDRDGSIHFQLGQAYRSTGETELAKQMLTIYQQMQGDTKEAQREMQEEIQITAP